MLSHGKDIVVAGRRLVVFNNARDPGGGSAVKVVEAATYAETSAAACRAHGASAGMVVRDQAARKREEISGSIEQAAAQAVAAVTPGATLASWSHVIIQRAVEERGG